MQGKGSSTDHGGGDILSVESHGRTEKEPNGYGTPGMYSIGT